jgi:hypothetical protein
MLTRTKSKNNPRKASNQFSCLDSENITKASQARLETNEANQKVQRAL